MTDSSPVLPTPIHEGLLKVALQVSCVAGFIAIVSYLFTPAPVGFKILAVLAYGLLVLITVLTGLPYPLRAAFFLLLLYFTGLVSLLSRGVPEGFIFFLGLIAMTALLLPSRSGIYYVMGIILMTILGFAWFNSSFMNWGWLAGIFLFISSVVGVGLYKFQQEFIQTQTTARDVLNTIQQEQTALEQRVEERTAELTRKSEYLRGTAYITRRIAEVQDLSLLLHEVAELVADQFQLYHVGVFLLNETGDQAVLQAASSEGGRHMIESGYASSLGGGDIIGYVAAQKKPQVALDRGADTVTFNNPDLPMTRSEIALPLAVGNRILGVLDIQSDELQPFSIDDIDILQALADQIAIAIENARLIDEAKAAILQLEALTNSRTRQAWGEKLRERSRVFTFTPLGLRAEKVPQSDEQAISAPIILRGQRIGTISIARKRNGAWSKLDKDLIDEVASQVGLAVDNIRLLEEATQRARQEQAVGKLAARFSQTLDLDTLLQTAARELGQLPDVSEVSVVISPETDQRSAPQQQPKWKTT